MENKKESLEIEQKEAELEKEELDEVSGGKLEHEVLVIKSDPNNPPKAGRIIEISGAAFPKSGSAAPGGKSGSSIR